ncbi:hypothetical protein DNTS_028675, partial [Danionella cerebrum]
MVMAASTFVCVGGGASRDSLTDKEGCGIAIELMESQIKEEPVLHIVVVGFHHKKGCQVEFSYPPIIPSAGHDSSALPEEWKYLPFLALPDGAHNHQE